MKEKKMRGQFGFSVGPDGILDGPGGIVVT
jgi:hypothetical protein